MAKKKKSRGLTFKEKVLITILFVVVIGYGTYTYLLTPLMASNEQTLNELNQKLEQKQVIDNELHNKDLYRAQIESLDENEVKYQKRFPVDISQDYIILKLYNYAKESKIHISTYSFGNLVESAVVDKATETNTALTETEKIQKAVNEKASEYTAQVEADVQKRFEEQLGIVTSEEEKGVKPISLSELLEVQNNEALKTQIIQLGSTLLSYDVNLNLTGTVDGVLKFYELIENSEDSVFITQNNIVSNESDLTVALTVRFIGYRDNEINGTTEMAVPEGYGSKPNIFSDEGIAKTNATPTVSNLANDDFSLVVQSYQNNGAKFYLMQGELDSSIIYMDQNSVLTIALTIEEIEGEIRYNYSISNARKSGVFKLKSNDQNLVFDIISTPRLDSKDMVGAKINITNKTNRVLEVNIKNDDPSKPRIIMNSINGKVQVN